MARRDLSGREEGLSGAVVPAVINHGSTASTARPDTTAFPVVIWIGTVVPDNMANGDIFMNVS